MTIEQPGRARLQTLQPAGRLTGSRKLTHYTGVSPFAPRRVLHD